MAAQRFRATSWNTPVVNVQERLRSGKREEPSSGRGLVAGALAVLVRGNLRAPRPLTFIFGPDPRRLRARDGQLCAGLSAARRLRREGQGVSGCLELLLGGVEDREHRD